MSADTPSTVLVDVRGFVCPSSLLVALRELNKYREALRKDHFIIELMVDNHDSTNRICGAVKSMGYDFAVTDRDNSYCIAVYRARTLKDADL
ncbi:sulfurtransferase TusA family protein [Pelovirga terrestris]|uniref:Sulfurtransferase TusA family protein n=1 Tax=Pelovirga terrestris TaxID=2771352 RepID=A0A8J6QW88_9BACT|nr:sulfurtransferase TusA family protein [Pelovirga terrestris]MBD1399453.1 sulfurtransferase TusA family protein [Pelovirga terrestris]